MLESCLENKIIYEFLTLYEHSFWKKLIPSLLEIAILNLKSSFNTLLFSEKDINNIIRDLKIKQKISYDFNNNQKSIQEKNKDKEKKNILYYKHFTESNTIDGLGDQDKTNNYIHCHSDKRKYKHINSKIKNLIDKDKRNYYYTNSENYLINNYNYNPRKRINYAISNDRNLTPEIIERTTFRNSKKGGKKIVQKMTQEEYEKKYNEDNIDNNEIYNEKNKSKKLFHSQGPNKIKNIDISENNLSPYKSINSYNFSNICIKNRSQKVNNHEKRNNLYHYKIRYSNQKNNNNNILIKNTKMANCGNYKNNMKNNIIEINANSLKDFGKHYFKSQNNKNQKKINHFKIKKNNKIINTDNNIISEDEQSYNNINNNNFQVNNSNREKNKFKSINKKNKYHIEYIENFDNKLNQKLDELSNNIENQIYKNFIEPSVEQFNKKMKNSLYQMKKQIDAINNNNIREKKNKKNKELSSYSSSNKILQSISYNNKDKKSNTDIESISSSLNNENNLQIKYEKITSISNKLYNKLCEKERILNDKTIYLKQKFGNNNMNTFT